MDETPKPHLLTLTKQAKIALVIALSIMAVVILWLIFSKPKAAPVKNADTGSAEISLQDLAKNTSKLDTGQLSVNGQLNVNDGIVLKPTARPEDPNRGQTYLDERDGQLYYFNGTTWVSLGIPDDIKALPAQFATINQQVQNNTAAVIDLTSTLDGKVDLQQSIGTAQTGNIVISGTAVAGAFQGSGAGLTNLNASNISIGTLSDARLSPNVALLDRPSQNFTGLLGVNSAPSGNGARAFIGGLLQFTAASLPVATPALNGSIVYDPVNDKFKIIEGGAYKELCNMTDLGCGAGSSVTLQNAYNNSLTPAGITTTSAGKTVFIRAGVGSDATALFAVQNSSSANVLAVDSTTDTVNVANLASAGSVSAVTLSGDGSGVTNVDAATLGGQAGAFYRNAGNINAGTLGDARLSANVALRNTANTFSVTSATAFIIQGGTPNLFAVNTQDNKIGLLQSPTTTGATLQVAGGVQLTAGALPVYSAALAGMIFYDTADNKFKIFEAGGTSASVKTLCNSVDGCATAGGAVTLQGAYDNVASNVQPASIVTSAAAKTLLFKAGVGFDSTSLFQVQASDNTPVLTVDTTNKLVGIGQAPGLTDVSLQVAGAARFYATSLPTVDNAHNGTIYYDAADDKFKIIEGGVEKTLCNDVNQACGAGTADIKLQSAYDGGSTIDTADNRDLVITLKDTPTDSRFLVDIESGSSGYFAVQAAGTNIFQVTSSLLNTSLNTINLTNAGTTTISSTGALTVTPGGALIIGQGSQALTLQGSTVNIKSTQGGFTTTLAFAAPGQDQTITIPDSGAASADICLSTGNCLGGSGGGANTALSNLSSVAINTTLLPAGFGVIDLGSNAKPFQDLFLSNTTDSFAYRITGGTLTGNVTLAFPDGITANDEICIKDKGNCVGTGGGITGTGTPDTVALFTGSGTIGDSLLTQDNPATYVNVGGNFKVQLNKFTVDGSTGNTAVAGTLGVTGDLAVNTNKFTVTASNGNTAVAGTLGVTGDVAVNTNKFTVTAASGNTSIAGTLQAAGDFSINTNKFNVAASSGNTSVGGTLGVASDLAVNTNKFTVQGSTGNTLVAGTLGVTGNVAVNTNKFTVDATSGNTAIAGTLTVGTNLIYADQANMILGVGVQPVTTGSRLQVAGGIQAITNSAAAWAVGLAGSLVYDTVADKLYVYDGTARKEICNDSGNCSSSGVTFQTVYDNSTSSPQILVNSTNGGLIIKNDPGGAITGTLFQVQDSSSGNILNVTDALVSVNKDFNVATNKFTVAAASGNVLAAGDLAVNGGDITSSGALNVTPTGTLTLGSTSQTFVLQGNSGPANSRLVASNGVNTTTVAFANPTVDATFLFPAVSTGSTYDICTSSGNCNGAGATLQTSYNNSAGGIVPEIKINNSTQGPLDIQDIDAGSGGNIINIRAGQAGNLGSILFGVSATTTSVNNNLLLKNTNPSALLVQNAGGTQSAFQVDTTNNRVVVGDADNSSSANSTLFVVDSASTANAPSGTNGGIYYDTTANAFRFFAAGSYRTVDFPNIAYLNASQTFTATNTFQPASNITGLVVKQYNNAGTTSDIMNVQVANGTNVLQVTGPSQNQAGVVLQSVGGGRDLNLNAGSGNVVFGVTGAPSSAVTLTTSASANLLLTAGAAASVNITSPSSSTYQTTAGNITIQGGSGIVQLGQANTGKIGIGTATPTAQLTVPGIIPSATTTTISISGGARQTFVQGNYLYVTNYGAPNLSIYDITNPASPTARGTATTQSGPYGLYVSGKYAYVTNYSAGSLQVINIENPNSPAVVSTTTVGTNPTSVFVQGQYAYVANSGSNSIQVFNVSNPALPTQMGSNYTTNLSAPISIYVQGKYAYVANYSGGTLKVLDVSNPASISETGSATVSNAYSVVVQGSMAYVADYSNGRTYPVNVSNPAAPSVGSYVSTGNNPVTLKVSGKRLYVGNYLAGTNVLDLSNPASPTSIGSFGSGATLGLSVSGRYTYVSNQNTLKVDVWDVGGTQTQQLEAGSIETFGLNVRDNLVVGNDIDARSNLSVGGNAFFNAQVTVSSDTLLRNSSTTALRLQNANAVSLLTGDTTNMTLTVAGNSANTALIVNNTSTGDSINVQSNGTAVFRITNAASAEGSAVFKPRTDNTTAFRIQRADGVTTVMTVDTTNQRLSVGTIGTATSQVYVSGLLPATPTGSATLPGFSFPFSVAVQGRYAFSGGLDNLYVTDVSNPTSPTYLSSLAMPTGAYPALGISGKYLYAVNNGSPATLTAVDISNPYAPTIVSSLTMTGQNFPQGLYAQGRYVYVTVTTTGNLAVYDVSNPAAMVQVSSTSLGASSAPTGLYVQGRYAYIGVSSGSGSTLRIYDVSNPASPSSVATYSIPNTSYIRSIAGQGRYIYYTDANSGVVGAVDVSNPASPSSTGQLTGIAGGPYIIKMQGRYAYVSLNNPSTGNKLQVFDFATPASPASLGTVSGWNQPYDLAVQGRYVYMPSTGDNTFKVVDLGGAYVQQFEAGGIESGSISTRSNITVGNDADIRGSLSVGQSTNLQGNLVTSGSALFVNRTNSTTAFQIQNASNTTLLGLDTTNNRIFSGIADGATAIGFTFNTPSYTTAGAKLLSIRNNGTEKFAIDKDGKVVTGLTPSARVYNNAALSIANNTLTALTFNSERWDNDTIHDTVSNTSRLTAKTGGLYTITALLEWANNVTGRREVRIKLNGTTDIAIQSYTPNGASDDMIVTTSYQLAANDYIEVYVLQNSGGALNVNQAGNYTPEFSMTRIGP